MSERPPEQDPYADLEDADDAPQAPDDSLTDEDQGPAPDPDPDPFPEKH